MNSTFARKITIAIFVAFLIFSPYPMVTAQADEVAAANTEEPPALALPEYRVVRVSEHYMTAYTSEVAQTDDSPCITANGYNVCTGADEDTIAANFLPFGTKVRIPELFGDRVFVVRDRMNRRHANRVDVWMREKSDAINFGIQLAKIEVVEKNN